MKLDIKRIRKIFLDHGFDENKVELALSANKYFRTSKEKNWHIRNRYEEIVDIDFCIKMYENENVPIYKIAMAYGICDSSLRGHMIKHGVHLKGHACGINSQNNYFEAIDTRDKAYFLGLIAADGSVVRKRGGAAISIELIASDSYILDRFNQYGRFNAKIYEDDRENSTLRRIIVISSRKIANDLAKYGIIQNKGEKDSIFIPEIPLKLIPHFIRGYFDGNGIANKHGHIGFCGSKTIIQQIHDYFVELYGVFDSKVTYNKVNHIYYVQWGSKADTRIIASVLYHDCIDLYLHRKQDKVFNRLRPETWRHVDLNLSKPKNIGCPA